MIKFKEIKAATIEAANESDATCAYDLSATVDIRNGEATRVQNGIVKTLAEEPAEVANFSGWSANSISINMNNVPEEEQDAVFTAVRSFIKELKTEASAFDISSLL